MTINEQYDMRVRQLESAYKNAQEEAERSAKIAWKFRRIPFLNKYYMKKYLSWHIHMNKMFRELRAVMQKEYPERFIGVNR